MSEEFSEAYGTTATEWPAGMTEFAEFMVKDETVPKSMRDMFWGFLNKETTLSRSDQRDRRRAENRFAILRNFYMMSKPQYKVDIMEIIEIQNGQHRNTVKNNRSFGGFERQALMTQIKELRTPKAPEVHDTGFLGSIKNKLGFGSQRNQREQYG